MKKSSMMWIVFVVIAIIAMIKMSSFMSGLGFALSIFIGGFSLMCIIGAICFVIVSIEEIKSKQIVAIWHLFMAVVMVVVGIAIFRWLIIVL